MVNWLFQISAVTFLLAIGIRFVEDRFPPLVRLVTSVAFGLLWLTAGILSVRVKSQGATGAHERAERNVRLIGWMFLVFSLIWIGISVYQFQKS